ncbi:MAG: hypothetical protein ACUZ8E_16735 [Candidatus Anammoxibacter sp.]
MKKLICCVLFVVVAMLGDHVVDGRVLEIDLSNMTRAAGKIVAGQCTGVKNGFHPEYPNVKVTFVDIDLYDVLKGDDGKHLQFMQFGHGIATPHASKYKKGEKVLLFLYPESQYGFTSPVGGWQGKLLITTDEVSGKPDFVKILNKRKLFKGLYTKKSDAMTSNIDLTNDGSKLVKYETFRQTIQAIINNGKNEEGSKE